MYAQSLILKVTGFENEPLVYASVYDTLHKQHLVTQEDGTVQLEYEQQTLNISSIGYYDTTLVIDVAAGPTFLITLRPKEHALIEVTVNARKPVFYKKHFEEGAYKGKNPNGLVFYQKQPIKFGALIHFSTHKERVKYLSSVKFTMWQARKRMKEDFLLAVNLYEVRDGIIADQPINDEPILIKSGLLRSKNDITFPEPYPLKRNAEVLVSVEIPKIGTGESKNSLYFYTGSDTEGPKLFIYPNYIKGWPSRLKSLVPQPHPIQGGFSRLALSVGYRILQDE